MLESKAKMENENSRKLWERSLAIAPGGVHSPVRAFRGVGGNPIFFQSGSGALLHSCDGRDYIDFCQSFGPLLLGHRPPEVQRVVEEMVHTLWTVGAPEPYSLELAEWIVAHVPWVEKLRFVCSGTEAVMSALRVARAATGRKKILKFSGCYHGHSDALLVQAGSGLAGQAESSSRGVPADLVAATLVAKLDDESNLEAIFQMHGADLAAVVLEPLPANYGLLPQRQEFLHFVCDLAKRSGTLILFDEVISGFRVSVGGMAELLGFRPDLVTYGKVVGGGFPVGCYGGRADLLSLVAPEGPVYQAGTLSANPIGMCAGLATLHQAFGNGGENWRKIESRSKNFFQELNKIIRARDWPLRLEGMSSLFWFRLGTENSIRAPERIAAKHAEWFSRFFHACLRQGIYLPPNAYEVGFVGLAHDEGILEQALRGFTLALEDSLDG